MAGFVIRGNDAVSLFKHDGAKAPGFAKDALAIQTSLGARRLDAFDTELPVLYAEANYRVVARLKWDEREKPPDWDYEVFKEYNNGRPDVVFAVYDPDYKGPYIPGTGYYVKDYGAGLEAQSQELAKLKRKYGAKYSLRGQPFNDIPLGTPMVESRVERLGEAEGRAREADPTYNAAELKRETPHKWSEVNQKAARMDFGKTDEQWVNLGGKKGRVLSDVEAQALKMRVALRREEMEDAVTRLAEATAMSAAERAAKGIDLNALSRQEMEKTFSYIALKSAQINAGTEAGRALAIFRATQKVGTDLTPDEVTRKILKEIPGGDVAELYRLYRSGDRARFASAVQDALQPTWAQKIVEYYRGFGLLTGIGTQVANFAGNTIEASLRLGDTLASAGMDKVLAKIEEGITGKPAQRERFAGEFRPELHGQLTAVPAAFSRFADAFVDQIIKQNEPSLDLGDKFDHQVGAIKGKKGTFVRTSFRLLGISDDFFKGIGGEAALQKLAYREARSEGFTGKQAQARAQMIANEARAGDPQWRGMMKSVVQEQLERTFQEDPARGVQSIMQFTRNHPLIGGIVLPFVKTPANITRAAWRRSPMGYLPGGKAWTTTKGWYRQQRALKAGGEIAAGEEISRGEVADALAKPMVGTVIATAFGMLAAAGLMTGSGPADKEEKKALLDTGWQPYSFKIPIGGGDHVYVPYTRFEPVSSLLGIVADGFEARDERKVFDKILTSVATNWTNKTFFKGLSDAARTITEPKIAAKNWAASTLGSLAVPAFVAKAAEGLDPYYRERRSMAGIEGSGEASLRTVIRRTPVASSKYGEPVYTPMGSPAERPGTGITRFVLPVQVSKTKAGKELEEHLVKIHAVPNEVPREVIIPKELIPRNAVFDVEGTRVSLNNEERAAVAQARVQAADYLRRNLAQLRSLPLDDQRDQVDKVFQRATRGAVRRLWVTSPSLRERARKQVGVQR